MSRFFSEEELRGALIVDSEGLVYGRVGGLKVEPSGVYLVGIVEAEGREIVVDREELVSRLKGRGVRLRGDEDLEYLVSRAREEGVEVPYTEADRGVMLVKGSIPVAEIRWIDKAELEIQGRREELVVVLLNAPREARYRGAHPQEAPPAPDPRSIEGRLVLGLEEGIMGYAGEIVVGPGEPGLRAYRRRGAAGYINWIYFTKRVRDAGYREIYDALVAFRDPLRHSRIGLDEVDEVKGILARHGAEEPVYRMLEDSVVRRGGEQSIYIDIPWSRVRKVRDTILVE